MSYPDISALVSNYERENMTSTKVNTTVNTTDEWETLNTGSIGEEWDFANGPLVGHFLGARTVETTKVDSGEATALQFSPRDTPDEIVFIWQSADLAAFTQEDGLIRQGDLVKISFLGIKQFIGADNKPRQLKQYKLQVPARRLAVALLGG